MAKKTKEKKDIQTGPRAKNDAYVMMLFISLLAIIGGSVLMYLDFDEYGKNAPPPPLKIIDLDTKGGDATGTPAPKADTKTGT